MGESENTLYWTAAGQGSIEWRSSGRSEGLGSKHSERCIFSDRNV